MKRTITITLNNRYNDAERIIGLFSGSGHAIERMVLTRIRDDDGTSQLTVVAAIDAASVENFLTRLHQQLRVSNVACVDGDQLTPDSIAWPPGIM